MNQRAVLFPSLSVAKVKTDSCELFLELVAPEQLDALLAFVSNSLQNARPGAKSAKSAKSASVRLVLQNERVPPAWHSD